MEFWKNQFKPYILDRGRNYWEQGRVQNLEFHHGIYSATVLGTKDYEVAIRTIGEAIEEMFCSCPYAADGHNCKHMAAVLYAVSEGTASSDEEIWEDGEREENMRQNDTGDNLPTRSILLPSPEALIDSMSEAKVREFLLNLAKEDPSVHNRLLFQCPVLRADDLKELLLSEVDAITDSYTVYDGIDYDDAYSYASDLADFISEKPIKLLNSGGCQAVLEVAFHALEEYCSQDVDDSDGGTSLLDWSIRSLCSSLLSEVDFERKRLVFSWFRNYQSCGEVHWIIESILDTLLDSFFKEPCFSAQKMEIIDLELQEAVSKGYSWKTEALLTKKYLLLRSMPDRIEEFKAFRSRYFDCSFIRTAEIQALIQEKAPEQAIALLRESRNIDREKVGLVKQYTEQLIVLYSQQEKTKELTAELLYHIQNFPQTSLDHLLKLKALIPESQWISIRCKYLDSPDSLLRLELMEAEGLWEEIMEVGEKEDYLHILRNYGPSLQPRFPDRFHKAYTRQLRREMQVYSSRPEYRKAIEKLRELSNYEGGKIAAEELAEEWKARYVRRPALLDELKKAGF